MVKIKDNSPGPPPAARLLTSVVNAGILVLLVGLLAAAAGSRLSPWLRSFNAASEPIPAAPQRDTATAERAAGAPRVPPAAFRHLPTPPEFPGHSPPPINL